MRAAALLAAALALVLAGPGCMKVGAYERGATIPYAEAESHRDDLGALVEEKLARKDADRAFYAMELARTRRFAADFLVKRDERRAPAQWVKELNERFYEGAVEQARSEGKPVPTKEKFLAEGFGPEDWRPEEDALALARSSRPPPVREATRAGREQAAKAKKLQDEDDEKFWEDLKLLEGQLGAMATRTKAEGVSYQTLFKDRCVVVSSLDARLTLAPGEALVEYYLGVERADAVVVTSEGATLVPLAWTGVEVADGVAALRKALVDDFSDMLKHARDRGIDPRAVEAWKAPSRALHDAIVAPVLAALAKSEPKVGTLLIVAPGPLANCPFAALADASGSLLVERYRIAYEPSFSVYKSILSRELPKEAPRILAVGNTSLAMAPKEAGTMGSIFEGSATWIGRREVTEARFYREVKKYNIFHFATHGLLVQSAPRLSHVLLGPGEGEDGLLTGLEIMWQLDLSHCYVAVLSACQTALSAQSTAAQGTPGGPTPVTREEKLAAARERAGKADAEISTITSAFLLAGAPSVVGSLWSVSDASTVKLMVRFYESFLEVGTAEALRSAQLVLLQDENVLFRHPYFWAAFGVYGLDK